MLALDYSLARPAEAPADFWRPDQLELVRLERLGFFPHTSQQLGFRLSQQAEPLQLQPLRHGQPFDIAKVERPKDVTDIPTSVLIPSFIISEVKTAFQIGLLLYVPFLVIDMVVASVLLSMGMMMLPPIMISLPFKLMLFVLADGWNLLIGSLVRSFA